MNYLCRESRQISFSQILFFTLAHTSSTGLLLLYIQTCHSLGCCLLQSLQECTLFKAASSYLKPFNTSFKEKEQCWLSEVTLRFCYQVFSCLYSCLDIGPIQGKEWTDYGVIPQESQSANMIFMSDVNYRATVDYYRRNLQLPSWGWNIYLFDYHIVDIQGL
jgi:hypothetical protein